MWTCALFYHKETPKNQKFVLRDKSNMEWINIFYKGHAFILFKFYRQQLGHYTRIKI